MRSSNEEDWIDLSPGMVDELRELYNQCEEPLSKIIGKKRGLSQHMAQRLIYGTVDKARKESYEHLLKCLKAAPKRPNIKRGFTYKDRVEINKNELQAYLDRTGVTITTLLKYGPVSPQQFSRWITGKTKTADAGAYKDMVALLASLPNQK